jgi:hypothetical protein
MIVGELSELRLEPKESPSFVDEKLKKLIKNSNSKKGHNQGIWA